jgi:hypothetical protein
MGVMATAIFRTDNDLVAVDKRLLTKGAAFFK